jgi:arginyl-tRNA synthetase
MQLVKLMENGEVVKMSKRRGTFVTLATWSRRWARRDPLRDAHAEERRALDFDFAKVTEQSKDNPVFYVQYAHARAQSSSARSGGGARRQPEALAGPTCRA